MSISLGSEPKKAALPKKFHRWFFEGAASNHKSAAAHKDSWWKVMCLTGVDYFSTLGYQPGIAFLAAGLLSPIATLIVVLVTLFGLLPLYKRVAAESPHGQGSIAMLENLLPGWSGKTLVLILLGFAATDFVITITLSAADATAHIVQNPMVPAWLDNKIAITSFMLAILAAVFLKGFREAIGLSVVIVSAYLFLNLIVIARASIELLNDPSIFQNWQSRLFASHHSVGQMLALSLLLFPKLALGMS